MSFIYSSEANEIYGNYVSHFRGEETGKAKSYRALYEEWGSRSVVHNSVNYYLKKFKLQI